MEDCNKAEERQGLSSMGFEERSKEFVKRKQEKIEAL